MKNKLAIEWKQNGISLLLFGKAGNLKLDSLRENETIKNCPVKGVFETILVLPRSEVLQKEMLLSGVSHSREDLEARLAQLLPYSPKEMAYSLAIHSSLPSEPSKGLLYAIPEQKINGILEVLKQAGLSVDEVVSEDQVLFWQLRDKAVSGPILIFDRTPERVLFLVIKKNAILLSSVYQEEEDLKSIFSEASFSLLESGTKPVRGYVSGSMDADEILRTFGIPVERLEPEFFDGVPVSFVLSAAKKWGSNPVISLLPTEQKLRKRVRNRQRLLTSAVAAFGAFLVCFSLLAASHLVFLAHKKSLLEKENAKLAPAVLELRQISLSLQAAKKAEYSKRRLLSFVRELAERVPASVRLKEFQMEGNSIVFQAESPSHGLLTETVQILEKMEGVREVKLEHARLRKRLNHDFFDFEVTARWQD